MQQSGIRVTKKTKKLRAIDLYSGVGGWSLGLRLAGIEVVASYEMWGPANETNFKNNGHLAQTVDIRRLSLQDLPTDIDIVVGSPPCTQFSFSNRGGGGDIADGLKDIIQFLKIVDHVRPRVWAMENVPRVAKIIDQELKNGGLLAEFSHLNCSAHLIDMSEYGLPQRRNRCIAGNFDIEILRSYCAAQTPKTLGEVISALAADPVTDPLFGIKLPRADVTDHIEEDYLSAEEVRINCANKTKHTVYNAMSFPDPLDRSVRTITATCTRVSRESIVISAAKNEEDFRRLTIRERASLQGFPITFQFYGANYGQKLRMIGNAVPPAFSYLMGCALQHRPASLSSPLQQIGRNLARPEPTPVITPPDRVGAKYPANRTFKFAIPSLQLKSGVRFELTNSGSIWKIAFYFGTSKEIRTLILDASFARTLASEISQPLSTAIESHLGEATRFVRDADIANMQALWAHRGPGGTRALMLLDKLDDIGAALAEVIRDHENEAIDLIKVCISLGHGTALEELPGLAKLLRNSSVILSGLLIGSAINPILERHAQAAGQHRWADNA